MTIQIYYLIFLTILYLISKILKRNFGYVYGLLSIFVFGQRWGSGTDFNGYLGYYLSNYQREYLYTYLQTLIIKYDLYFGLLIFIVYSITVSLFIYFIKKIVKNSNDIIYIFFLSEIHFAITSQIRNWAAVSFFLCSYYLYKIKAKKILSILFLLLGYGFHKSIIYVIPLILFKIKLTNKLKFRLLVLSGIISTIDFKIILKFFTNFHYIDYLNSEYNYSLSWINKIKFLVVLLMYIIYFISEKRKKESKEDIFIEQGAYIYLLTYAISLNMGMFLRISHYFKIFELLYLFNMIEYTKIRKLKIIPCIYIFIYFIGCLLTNAYGYKEYEFKKIRIYRDFPKEKYFEYLREIQEKIKNERKM